MQQPYPQVPTAALLLPLPQLVMQQLPVLLPIVPVAPPVVPAVPLVPPVPPVPPAPNTGGATQGPV